MNKSKNAAYIECGAFSSDRKPLTFCCGNTMNSLCLPFFSYERSDHYTDLAAHAHSRLWAHANLPSLVVCYIFVCLICFVAIAPFKKWNALVASRRRIQSAVMSTHSSTGLELRCRSSRTYAAPWWCNSYDFMFRFCFFFFFIGIPKIGMFGPSFGQQSSYNYFPNNGDFDNNSSFGSHMNAGQQHPQQQQQYQKQQQQKRGQQYDDYYRGADKHGYDGVKVISFFLFHTICFFFFLIDSNKQQWEYTKRSHSSTACKTWDWIKMVAAQTTETHKPQQRHRHRRQRKHLRCRRRWRGHQ